MAELNTYGDLKKVLSIIKAKQRGETIGKATLDVVLGNIPGIGMAKDLAGLLKAAFKKPDTKKTGTWLDKLDVDDKMLDIIDDAVENGFLEALANEIEGRGEDERL